MTEQLDSADLLYGVAAIATFLGIPRRAAQHKIDTGDVPTFRLGKNICARRTGLRSWLAECEAAAKAEREATALKAGRAE